MIWSVLKRRWFSLKKWIKKFFVTLVTVLTFGMVTPYQAPVHAVQPVNRVDDDRAYESNQSTVKETSPYDLMATADPVSVREKFLYEAVQQGEQQALEKFGSKIGPVIEEEFQAVILPNIEQALKEVTEQFPEEDLTYLSLTEAPAGGFGEKIFHVFNEKTGQDIIRFHVRRDKRPGEGYWFNFHYHTYHDGFEKHHLLGEIYWDKNTPPKWKS